MRLTNESQLLPNQSNGLAKLIQCVIMANWLMSRVQEEQLFLKMISTVSTHHSIQNVTLTSVWNSSIFLTHKRNVIRAFQFLFLEKNIGFPVRSANQMQNIKTVRERQFLIKSGELKANHNKGLSRAFNCM